MEKLKVEDKSRIENVIFIHPELMSSNASEHVKEKYSRMINIDKSLQEKRAEVRSLEEEQKKAREEWESIKKMCTYTHPTIEKEYYKGECNFAIKGHGNDIIGKTTVRLYFPMKHRWRFSGLLILRARFKSLQGNLMEVVIHGDILRL